MGNLCLFVERPVSVGAAAFGRRDQRRSGAASPAARQPAAPPGPGREDRLTRVPGHSGTRSDATVTASVGPGHGRCPAIDTALRLWFR
jgi:hypothetical protein